MGSSRRVTFQRLTDERKCNFAEDLIDCRGGEKVRRERARAEGALPRQPRLILRQKRERNNVKETVVRRSGEFRRNVPDVRKKRKSASHLEDPPNTARDRFMSGRAFRENYRVSCASSIVRRSVCPLVSRLRRACFEYRSKVNGQESTYVAAKARRQRDKLNFTSSRAKSFHGFHE